MRPFLHGLLLLTLFSALHSEGQAQSSPNAPSPGPNAASQNIQAPAGQAGSSATKTSARGIQGKIIDRDSRNPIHFASVSLLGKDSALIAGAESLEDGTFHFLQMPEGPLLLRVSFVGYASFYKKIPAGHGPGVQLGTISLGPDPAQLQTVVVSAEKNAFKSEIDKKVFNVEKSLASKGGTAVDALRQVPTLSVSATGNVSLRNGSPVILLDGKRTNLSLDQIPSDQIQSIEVMPNPSAKYDAQGNNGIVNIVLKKNRKTGLNGSVAGIWNTLGENYGFLNLNSHQGRFNFFMNAMYHHHRSGEETRTTRTNLVDHTSFDQRGESEMQGPYQFFKLGSDFFIDQRNTLSLSGDIAFGKHPSTGSQTTDFRDASGSIDSSSFRHTPLDHRFTFSHATLDYSHEFKKEKEKLTASAALEAFHGPDKGSYDMQYLDKNGVAMNNPFLQRFNTFIRAHGWTLQSDFTDPLRDGKAKWEAGVKAILHKDHNFYELDDYDGNSGEYSKNPQASYNYQYSDNTYAAYTSYSDRIGSFSYMAGLRFEDYEYKGQMLDSNLNVSFNNRGFYPSLFLTQKTGDNSELHLNYSRRVNRPGFQQISPKTDYSNPQNPQQGNPGLQPENTNLVELSYNTLLKNTSLITTLFVKNTLHTITEYSIPLSGDTLLSTYKNANSSNTYGAETVMKIPLLKWWTATANLNLFQTSIHADNLSQGLSNNGFSWFAKVSTDMKVSTLFSFQLTGNYEGPQVMAQGKTLASGGLDIAVKKDLLKNKAASVVISVSDLLNTEKERIRTFSDNLFIQDTYTKPLTRMLRVNFTYSFGKDRNKPA